MTLLDVFWMKSASRMADTQVGYGVLSEVSVHSTHNGKTHLRNSKEIGENSEIIFHLIKKDWPLTILCPTLRESALHELMLIACSRSLKTCSRSHGYRREFCPLLSPSPSLNVPFIWQT